MSTTPIFSMQMKAVLSPTFFGPVQWYQKLNRYDVVYIDCCDSYQKQTYRNRCLIATTNGIQALTVPVEHGENCAVSSHGNWRHQHWQALTSAYGDSPFFQYYEDDLRPFFTQSWQLLYDFDEAIRQCICGLLDIHPNVTLTDHYLQGADLEGIDDFRTAIHPKHPLPDALFEPRCYYQVYRQKHGFLPNLSILDLLFNMGPESIFYL